jgi:hypothetical protein
MLSSTTKFTALVHSAGDYQAEVVALTILQANILNKVSGSTLAFLVTKRVAEPPGLSMVYNL